MTPVTQTPPGVYSTTDSGLFGYFPQSMRPQIQCVGPRTLILHQQCGKTNSRKREAETTDPLGHGSANRSNIDTQQVSDGGAEESK